jgi:hypothetical protein
MFSVGDTVTIKSGGMYDDCGCEYCDILSAGGYGIIQSIVERTASNDGPVCKIHLFDADGTLTSTAPYSYRLTGLEVLYKEPDWEI